MVIWGAIKTLTECFHVHAGYEILPTTRVVSSSTGLLRCTDTLLILCPQVAHNISAGTVLVGTLDTYQSAGPSTCTMIARTVTDVSRADHAVVLNTTAASLPDMFASYSFNVSSVAAAVLQQQAISGAQVIALCMLLPADLQPQLSGCQ